MYSNFKQQAIDYVKQAVAEDNAGNYAKAFPLYMNALEYFKTHLKYEKNPEIKEAIELKFTEYLRRAEEIRIVLDDGFIRPPPSYGGSAAAMADAGGEGYGHDKEKWNDGAAAPTKLEETKEVVEYHSNFKEQAIEYVKQAVAEDNAGNYAKAFPLYMNALEYFKVHLKYEKNLKIKEAIALKFTEYLRRAEEIRMVLDEGGPSSTRPPPPWRPSPRYGGGGRSMADADYKEKEKPTSVKWNDVAAPSKPQETKEEPKK